MASNKKKFALVSVYDKTGIVNLGKALIKKKYSIISTGGTAKILKKAKIPIIPIHRITGNPEAFDGRMKTISFQIESGILFDRENKNHQKQAHKLNVPQIDVVVCNFYPFEKVLKKENLKDKELIEMIDIGGPTMVRAAAKNHNSVAVVTDTNDYQTIIGELKRKAKLSLKTRQKLAIKAFKLTAFYDSLIHQVLSTRIEDQKDLYLQLAKDRKLRYGENPHQEGYLYTINSNDRLSLNSFEQIQGKELSFNNLLDCNVAINNLSEIANGEAACVIIKHGNPCGAALDNSEVQSFLKAWDSDPLAAFGSIIAINKKVTKKLANLMIANNRFFEVLLAPKFTVGAKKIFSKKKNLRLLVNKNLSKPKLSHEWDFKKIRGGFLVQEPDLETITRKDLKVVTQKKPTGSQIKELLFAWVACRCCKSNSIVISKNMQLVGAGVGQQDRMRCCHLAVSKAGKRAENAVAASDAFFPFADGPEILIKAGVKAIIQPGGSINDKKIIDLCNKYNIAMVFTGIRCFKH